MTTQTLVMADGTSRTINPATRVVPMENGTLLLAYKGDDGKNAVEYISGHAWRSVEITGIEDEKF